MREWLVLLEAERDGAGDPIDVAEVSELQEFLDRGQHGGHLHSPDRYALQVRATGATPVEALIDGVARWTDAVRQLALPGWSLVRTEVFTPEDLEREFERAEREESDACPSDSKSRFSEHDRIGLELLHQVFLDTLTGLLGRPAFIDRLEAALVGPGACPEVVVVRLDLDGFQSVNDVFGAAIADGVLAALSERIAATVRSGDVLARLGGDEYGVLLENITEQDALAVAERMLGAVARGATIDGRELTLSASAGLAVGRPGDAPETILANAHAALGAAKVAGGGPVVYGSDVSLPIQNREDFATAPLQDRLAHLHLIQHAAVAANEAETLHQGAQEVLRHLCTQVGCAVGHVWTPSASGEVPETPLWHIPQSGGHRALLEAATELMNSLGGDLLGRVMTNGRVAWIEQVADPNGDVLPRRRVTAAGLNSAFAFPVMVGPEVVAVLAFFSRTRMEPTGSFDDVLAGIGTQLGRVVERERAATALRRSAERLAASEARLREAQRMAGLGNWYFDIGGGTSSWSEGMYDLFGLPPGEPLALDSTLAFVHPDDRGRVQVALSRLVETGERTAADFRIVRADGAIRWHHSEGSGVLDEEGNVAAIHGTAQDITKAKQVEQDLRRAKELYQRIVETTHEGILTIDTQNVITFVNARIAEMLGYSVEEMIGMAAIELMEQETAAGLAGRNKRRRDGMSEHYQAQLKTKDGAVVRVLVSASPLVDENGRYGGALAMVTDVSTVREAEEILRSQSWRVQEMDVGHLDGSPPDY